VLVLSGRQIIAVFCKIEFALSNGDVRVLTGSSEIAVSTHVQYELGQNSDKGKCPVGGLLGEIFQGGIFTSEMSGELSVVACPEPRAVLGLQVSTRHPG